MLDGILQGLSTAVMPMNIMMVIVGCFVGTFIGMLPGLGPISAIALMIPITYGLEPPLPYFDGGCLLRCGIWWFYIVDFDQRAGLFFNRGDSIRRLPNGPKRPSR